MMMDEMNPAADDSNNDAGAGDGMDTGMPAAAPDTGDTGGDGADGAGDDSSESTV